jgi:uncharacterized protein YuzE
MKIRFELDPQVNALYVRFADGEVAHTVEIEEALFIDVSEEGEPLGIEFVNADDFLPFLRRHEGLLKIPERLKDDAAGLFSAAD